eukprot:5887330-Pleurochrysis_carterae.AAC.1
MPTLTAVACSLTCFVSACTQSTQAVVIKVIKKRTLLNMVCEAADPKKFLAELREEDPSCVKRQCVQDETALVMDEYGEYRARDRCFTQLYMHQERADDDPFNLVVHI